MDSFSVSNFRIFGSEGVKVDFKPVTILTGKNSSGKSSFVKAILLFNDYLEIIRNGFSRDGSFDPSANTLDFSRADLKMKGFSNVLNRYADKNALVTFSYDVRIMFYTYRVEYNFRSGTSKGLDSGVLDSIIIKNEDNVVFSFEARGSNLIGKEMHLGNLLELFMCFESLYNIPNQIIDSYKNPYGEFCSVDILNDDYDRISMTKFLSTEKGQQLKRIQNQLILDIEDKDTLGWIGIKFSHPEWLKDLAERDLSNQVEEFLTTHILFYFPVLERFRDLDKENSIRVLREEVINSRTVSECTGSSKISIEKIIDDFVASDQDSFIDFYSSLENEFLNTYRESIVSFGPQIGKKFDFIVDHVLQHIECSYSSNSFFFKDSAFSRVYDMLSSWQWGVDENNDLEWVERNKRKKCCDLYEEDNQYIRRSAFIDEYNGHFSSCHRLYNAFLVFVEYVLRCALMPDTLSKGTYYNGSFSTVQRLHTFEDNSILTHNVRKYLENKQDFANQGNNYIPDSFMNKWLVEFGIGKSIKIEIDEEGLGFKLFVEKNDGSSESLADLGHGATQMASLLIMFENTILGQLSSIDETYPLPPFEFYSKSKEDISPIIFIEEPEVSLHPCMQSKLATMFEEASSYGIQIIVETHSEYLIRKTQAIASLCNKDKRSIPFSIYYFDDKGGAYDLGYTECGSFVNQFGAGFLDEARNLAMEVINNGNLIVEE